MKLIDITSHKYKIFNRFWWYEVYTELKSWIRPRNKWLTNKIPNTYRDNDYLMEVLILECIKQYVEADDGLYGFDEGQADPNYPDDLKKFDREVKKMYDWITITIPSLEKQIDDFSPTDSNFDKLVKLENEVINIKTEVMLWAVYNRSMLWT